LRELAVISLKTEWTLPVLDGALKVLRLFYFFVLSTSVVIGMTIGASIYSKNFNAIIGLGTLMVFLCSKVLLTLIVLLSHPKQRWFFDSLSLFLKEPHPKDLT
jgi:hypothetical protein